MPCRSIISSAIGTSQSNSTGPPVQAMPWLFRWAMNLGGRTWWWTSMRRAFGFVVMTAFPCVGGGLPAIAHADRGSVHVEVFDAAVRVELVAQRSPGADDLELCEAVADAGGRLPGEVGIAGTGIRVEGHEPVALGAESELALDARDAVPAVAALARLAGLGWPDERPERRAEGPVQRRLRVELACAGEDVKRHRVGRDRPVAETGGEDRGLDVELRVGGDSRRQR